MSFFKTGGTIKWFDCKSTTVDTLNCHRFNDKKRLAPSAALFNNYWRELIGKFGWKICYYPLMLELEKADMLYGEDPLAPYDAPKDLLVLITLDESNNIIQRFGFNAEDSITAHIHINTYSHVFKDNEYYKDKAIEPKAGDIFALSEYGSSRPGDRGAKLFKITRVMDSNITENINTFGFHYVWQIKAKRFDFSFEKNIKPEKGSSQVYDEDLNKTNVLSAEGQQFTNIPSDILSSVAKPDTFSPNKEGKTKRVNYDGFDELYGKY